MSNLLLGTISVPFFETSRSSPFLIFVPWLRDSGWECTATEALPGLCDKGQFDYFLTIRFLGFSFLQSVGLLRFAPNGAATIQPKAKRSAALGTVSANARLP